MEEAIPIEEKIDTVLETVEGIEYVQSLVIHRLRKMEDIRKSTKDKGVVKTKMLDPSIAFRSCTDNLIRVKEIIAFLLDNFDIDKEHFELLDQIESETVPLETKKTYIKNKSKTKKKVGFVSEEDLVEVLNLLEKYKFKFITISSLLCTVLDQLMEEEE